MGIGLEYIYMGIGIINRKLSSAYIIKYIIIYIYICYYIYIIYTCIYIYIIIIYI